MSAMPAHIKTASPPTISSRLWTLRELFSCLQEDARYAESREELTELHGQAAYFVRLACGIGAAAEPPRARAALQALAHQEFARATDALNHRGQELGLTLDLSPGWAG